MPPELLVSPAPRVSRQLSLQILHPPLKPDFGVGHERNGGLV